MAKSMIASEDPDEGDQKPGVVINVQPRLDERTAQEAAEQIRNAVSAGVRDAIEDILFGLSLTDEDRAAVAAYRTQRAAVLNAGRNLVNRAARAAEAV